jgi:SAM-dependent methyltransferase
VSDTKHSNYTEYLQLGESRRVRWWLSQTPYRWHMQLLRLGRTLDVGCGVGRNLSYVGNGVGVDHNATSVARARERGLTAYTVDEFFRSDDCHPAAFDSALLSHVVEHLSPAEARSVVASYLPCVRPGGRIVFITPQERGHASDPTHVRFSDFRALGRLATDLRLIVQRAYSFPLPRIAGPIFTYNEFVVVACRP